jgi:hypothetical protein
LYLRSIPDDVVREAKAAAARRGITLTSYVSQTLAKDLGLHDASSAPVGQGEPDPRRTGRTSAPAGLEAEMAWYDSHRQSLLRRYRGEYVAIAGQRVVDHDHEFGRLARRVFKRYGSQPVCMPKVTEGERAVTIASPRLAGT